MIPPDLREGTLHSWNVAFQRQLPFACTADIAYVGNRGVDLVMDVDTNASMVYGSGNAGRPQFAQFNRTGNSRTRTNDGKSHYDGLQMKVDRRFRNGLMVTNSYTLSRSMDYVNENTTIGTPIDFELSWGRSNFDRLHNYVLTRSTSCRGARASVDDRRHCAGKIIGGWQVSGLFVAQSGTPLTITGNGTLLNTPGNTRVRQPERRAQGARRARPRPAVLRSGGLLAAGGRHAGQPAPQQRPGRARLLAARRVALQAVRVGGARYAEFRIDAFNVTNAVRWGNPTTGFSTATGNTFGQITGPTGGASGACGSAGRFVF